MTKLLLFVEKFCVFIQKEDYHFCIWLFVKNFDVYSTKKDVEIISRVLLYNMILYKGMVFIKQYLEPS